MFAKNYHLHWIAGRANILPETLKYWLVFSGVSLTSWGEGASLALVGHSSSDGVTIKMLYGIDVLHRRALYPIFSCGLVKTGFIVRSVETGLGR